MSIPVYHFFMPDSYINVSMEAHVQRAISGAYQGDQKMAFYGGLRTERDEGTTIICETAHPEYIGRVLASVFPEKLIICGDMTFLKESKFQHNKSQERKRSSVKSFDGNFHAENTFPEAIDLAAEANETLFEDGDFSISGKITATTTFPEPIF